VELNQDTEIEIYFLDRIRDERKFPSVEDLRAQIGKDIARAQRYLRRLGAPSFPEKELSK
jgi:riboflavin kinase/FMN adenylyltransferase